MTVLFQVVMSCLGVGGIISALLYRGERRKGRMLRRTLDCLEIDMESITSNLSSGLMIVDRRGMIKRVNPAAARILSTNEVAEEHVSIHDYLQPGHFEFVRSITHVLAGGERIHRREIGIRTPNRELSIGISVTPLGDEDDVQGAVALFQDLSEIKRLQKQKKDSDQLAALGELSAGIAHEIRNPLGSIRGCAEMLSNDAEAQGQDPRLLKLILKESGRVNRIISDFLSFARQPHNHPTLISAENLLEEIAMISRIDDNGYHGTTRISVRTLPPDMLLFVDEEQIKQILLNLCQNACDAVGPEIGSEVVLEAILDLPGKAAILRVSDNGPGVPQQEQEKIFEPFHTTKKTGTGLGLAIARRIAHAQGGELGVHNAIDGGAVFTLRLPLTRSVRSPDDSIIKEFPPETICADQN